MSKKLNDNERYLQNLSNQGRKVPPAPVWDEIEAELDAGVKRKPLLPWMRIGGLSLLVLTSAFWLMSDTSSNKELAHLAANQAQENIVETLETAETTPTTKGIESNVKPTNTKSTNTTATKTITTNNRTESDSAADNLETKIQNTNNQEASHPTTTAELQPKQRVSYTEKIQTSQESLSRGRVEELSVQKASPSNVESTQISVQQSSMVLPTPASKPNTATRRAESRINTASSNNKLLTLNSIETTPAHLDYIVTYFDIDQELPNFDDKLLPIEMFSFDRPIPEVKKISPWFLEAAGGLGREVTSPEVINSSLGQYRLNTELKWYSWSSAFHIGYQLDNKWYGKLGAEINQSKDKFDYLRKDVTSLIADTTGQSFHQIVKGDEFSIGEIRYTYLDLSLQVGYRQTLGKSLLSIEGGPIFNTQLQTMGKVMVGDREISRMEEQDFFKSQVGIGGRISLSLDYPIGEHLWLSFGPSYHQYFTGISSQSNSLDQRSAALQARMRLRCHF